MFTGLISDMGEIVALSERAEGLRRIKVACNYRSETLADGASIACAGVCLTVVGSGQDGNRAWFAADAAAETLRLTTVGSWQVGARINLERPLRISDELGGHIVAGHVDGIATVAARAQMTEMTRFELRAPHALARFIAPKGSVALDGVSLTVNEVAGDTFAVLIIPHTLKVTTLATLDVGSAVNIEVDLMARYAARLTEAGS